MDRLQRDFRIAEAALPSNPIQLQAKQIGRPLPGGDLAVPESDRRHVTVGVVADVRGVSKIGHANINQPDSAIGA
jgi:hypothetical protein